MTTATLSILFLNMDVASLMHPLEMKTQLLSFHTYCTLNAHQTTGIFPSFTHAGKVEENSIEGHRKVSAALFHDRGLGNLLKNPFPHRRIEEALVGSRSMDVVSHWFWGVLVTRKHVNWKVAGPMAVLPDLLAFIPSLVYSLANGIERPTVDDTTVTSDFPAIAWEMYQYTHSAVVVTLAVLLTWGLFTRFKGSRFESQFAEQYRSKPLKMAFLLWIPWYLNILLDIPSHTLQFFPTPVFFPLSDFHIDGTRWSTPIVLFTNVGVLVVLWAYVLRKDRIKRQEENQPLV